MKSTGSKSGILLGLSSIRHEIPLLLATAKDGSFRDMSQRKFVMSMSVFQLGRGGKIQFGMRIYKRRGMGGRGAGIFRRERAIRKSQAETGGVLELQ